jgi:hypothetical protein
MIMVWPFVLQPFPGKLYLGKKAVDKYREKNDPDFGQDYEALVDIPQQLVVKRFTYQK